MPAAPQEAVWWDQIPDRSESYKAYIRITLSSKTSPPVFANPSRKYGRSQSALKTITKGVEAAEYLLSVSNRLGTCPVLVMIQLRISQNNILYKKRND